MQYDKQKHRQDEAKQEANIEITASTQNALRTDLHIVKYVAMMSLIMTFITIRRAAIKGHYGLEEFTDVSGRQGSTVSKLKTF